MASLNKKAKRAADGCRISACTDITGFGLLGHCAEMVSASEVTFELKVRDIAYFEDAIDYAKMGLVPAGTYKNRGYSGRRWMPVPWRSTIWTCCTILRRQEPSVQCGQRRSGNTSSESGKSGNGHGSFCNRDS